MLVVDHTFQLVYDNDLLTPSMGRLVYMGGVHMFVLICSYIDN